MEELASRNSRNMIKRPAAESTAVRFIEEATVITTQNAKLIEERMANLRDGGEGTGRVRTDNRTRRGGKKANLIRGGHATFCCFRPKPAFLSFVAPIGEGH